MPGSTLQREAVIDDLVVLDQTAARKLREVDSYESDVFMNSERYAVAWMRSSKNDEDRAVVLSPTSSIFSSAYLPFGDRLSAEKRMKLLLGEDVTNVTSYTKKELEDLGVKIRPTDSNKRSWQSFAVAIGVADGAWIASDQAFGIANYSAEDTFNSQWELYSNLDTLFTLSVPGAASLVLLGYRYYKNGELVCSDAVDAAALFTKMAGAVSGWNLGNNIAEISLKLTGASSVEAGELIGHIAIGEVIGQTLAQALLIGGCAAVGLTFANFLFTTLAAGVEEARKAANDPQKSSFVAFWEGFGRAAKAFFYNKDNYKLMGAGFVGAIIWFSVSLAASAFVASGVLTAGAVPIVTAVVATLITAVVNYYAFYKIAKPTTAVEKMAANGIFSSTGEVRAANDTEVKEANDTEVKEANDDTNETAFLSLA